MVKWISKRCSAQTNLFLLIKWLCWIGADASRHTQTHRQTVYCINKKWSVSHQTTDLFRSFDRLFQMNSRNETSNEMFLLILRHRKDFKHFCAMSTTSTLIEGTHSIFRIEQKRRLKLFSIFEMKFYEQKANAMKIIGKR